MCRAANNNINTSNIYIHFTCIYNIKHFKHFMRCGRVGRGGRSGLTMHRSQARTEPRQLSIVQRRGVQHSPSQDAGAACKDVEVSHSTLQSRAANLRPPGPHWNE